jgi:branched-chain amino acid transport system permease protein
VTLGFGEIVRVILQGTSQQLDWSDAQRISATPFIKLFAHLGGALGFIGIPTYTTMFWVYAFVFTTLVVVTRLKCSSYGRAMLTIREDEIAAQAMGVNITKLKVRAFVIGAFFAGVAGALFAMQIGSINAGELGFQKSFDIVIMVVLGGMGSITGAALAAVLLTILPELLRDPPSLWPWGLIVVGVLAAIIFFHAHRKVRALIALAIAGAIWQDIWFIANQYDVNLADYRMIIYALSLIIMMIVRPQGLFGVAEVWDFWPFTLLRRAAPGGRP